MKNKQHEYILRAFMESRIPLIIRSEYNELLLDNSIVAGYCSRLLNGCKRIEIIGKRIISNRDRVMYCDAINHTSGDEKIELVLYYRLLVIVESILLEYDEL